MKIFLNLLALGMIIFAAGVAYADGGGFSLHRPAGPCMTYSGTLVRVFEGAHRREQVALKLDSGKTMILACVNLENGVWNYTECGNQDARLNNNDGDTVSISGKFIDLSSILPLNGEYAGYLDYIENGTDACNSLSGG